MPEFKPGEGKRAIVPITVSPAGLGCEAELFLGPNDMTKVAISGKILFTSTGISQDVNLPLIMPSVKGSYHVYIDIYAGGYLIATYQAIEDVIIIAAIPPGAEFGVSNLIISPTEINPGHPVTISCTVTNIGSAAGSFTVHLEGDFMAERTITLEPEQSEAVSFEAIPTIIKTYQVSVDGLSGSFKAVEVEWGMTYEQAIAMGYTPEELRTGIMDPGHADPLTQWTADLVGLLTDEEIAFWTRSLAEPGVALELYNAAALIGSIPGKWPMIHTTAPGFEPWIDEGIALMKASMRVYARELLWEAALAEAIARGITTAEAEEEATAKGTWRSTLDHVRAVEEAASMSAEEYIALQDATYGAWPDWYTEADKLASYTILKAESIIPDTLAWKEWRAGMAAPGLTNEEVLRMYARRGDLDAILEIKARLPGEEVPLGPYIPPEAWVDVPPWDDVAPQWDAWVDEPPWDDVAPQWDAWVDEPPWDAWENYVPPWDNWDDAPPWDAWSDAPQWDAWVDEPPWDDAPPWDAWEHYGAGW